MLNFAGYQLSYPVWLTGGGGKTSLMYYLAGSQKGPLILTTSTKLAYPPREELPFYQLQKLEEALPLVKDERKILVGSRVEKEKIIGFSPKELDAFYRQYKIPLIIEADGSNRRPLKIHWFHEPALPEVPETVIAVVGLSALNKPYSGEYIHRAEEVQGRLITPELLLKLVLEGKYFAPHTKKKVVFLNQADLVDAKLLRNVVYLFKSFTDVLVTYGSLREGYILPG
ncbi:selenium cofactor biosynthesis protein YqeC [Carboxydothermus ferrireducens]|uniref:Selenium-dependent hydroxylase accessory protein YqeC n=1 Tax=Carboxydothermus ferrireducens DSM 11255 TaxID=1119529 RepID=A0ABX2R8U3_9THEO|nr:selenium cofactor biosynthesis protein YqeC [Carboxydothermus ferrireducens]NYE56561.1 putative selenium-dependent hydroxylase accessory protein YqeC [Carboxydothermus ferrireducens DSM 11255]